MADEHEHEHADAADAEYRTFITKVGTGATLSEAQWLFHFEHQNAGARDGLALGATVPDFTLPDQSGRSRTVADLTGTQGLLLTFARSADW